MQQQEVKTNTFLVINCITDGKIFIYKIINNFKSFLLLLEVPTCRY